MPKDPNLPQKIRLGRIAKSQEVKAPKKSGNQGKIITNLQDINWTPSKLTITIAALSLPYLAGLVVSLAVGNYLIAGVFVGIGLLVIGIYLLLRYIEKSDF